MTIHEDVKNALEKINECAPYAERGAHVRCSVSSFDELDAFKVLQRRGAINLIYPMPVPPGGAFAGYPEFIEILTRFDELCKEYSADIKPFPNRKYDKDMWNTLNKIKEGESHIEKGEPIQCDTIEPSDEAIVFKQLQAQEIINISSKTNKDYGRGESGHKNIIYHLEITDHNKFDARYEKYRRAFEKGSKANRKDALEGKQVTATLGIYYNKTTGIGHSTVKRFKFYKDQPEFVVFKRMYSNINHSISREEILKLCQYDENTQELSNKYFLNNLAKKMRKRTGLTPDQITLNRGDLTLVGQKLKNPPK